MLDPDPEIRRMGGGVIRGVVSRALVWSKNKGSRHHCIITYSFFCCG